MSTDSHSDEFLMGACLDLAREAGTRGETSVGALVARDGTVIGRGQERTRRDGDPTAHAEVVAIRDAIDRLEGTDLNGCTLVTTVEPCVMCAYVIRESGIGRVIWGTEAGEVGGALGRHPLLGDSKMERWNDSPEQVAGIRREECRQVLME